MNAYSIYPWQQQEWQRLQTLQVARRLPHALLLTGQNGVGKKICADEFIRSLLCKKNCTRDKRCHDCHLLKENVHPNLLAIHPDGKSRTIKIEQIRSIIDFVAQSSLMSGLRVVLIHAADCMNHHAANALLKTLEEPADDAILILLAENPGLLPATIISRCQRIHFKTPDKTIALAWMEKEKIKGDLNSLLALAHGAPLRARSLSEPTLQSIRQEVFAAFIESDDILSRSAALVDHDLLFVFDLLISFSLDVLRLQLHASQKYLVNIDYAAQLISLSTRITCQRIIIFLQQIQNYQKQLMAGINLNKQLVLEHLLIGWSV